MSFSCSVAADKTINITVVNGHRHILHNGFSIVVFCDSNGEKTPESIEEKIALLLHHKLAIWDVLESCEITGSDDASIKQPVPNDIAALIAKSSVMKICCNGKKAYALYQKHCNLTIPAVCLPSTSPANAAWDLERLRDAWSVIQ